VCYSGWAGVTDIETGKQSSGCHRNTLIRCTVVNCTADGGAGRVRRRREQRDYRLGKRRTGRSSASSSRASKGLWAVGWGKDGKSLAWGYTNAPGADGFKPFEQTLRLDEFLPGDPPKPENFIRHVRADGAYSIKVDDFFNFTVSENGKPLYKHKSRSDRLYSVSFPTR